MQAGYDLIEVDERKCGRINNELASAEQIDAHATGAGLAHQDIDFAILEAAVEIGANLRFVAARPCGPGQGFDAAEPLAHLRFDDGDLGFVSAEDDERRADLPSVDDAPHPTHLGVAARQHLVVDGGDETAGDLLEPDEIDDLELRHDHAAMHLGHHVLLELAVYAGLVAPHVVVFGDDLVGLELEDILGYPQAVWVDGPQELIEFGPAELPLLAHPSGRA